MTAHKLFDERKYQECLTVANMMLNAGHEELKGHGYLIVGACYFNMGCIDESIVYSKCAIEYNPNLAGAYYNLANALKAKNRLDEAKSYLHQSLVICPSFVGAHLFYANILSRLGQLEEACKEYQAVISLTPNMLVAYYNLSVLQLNLRKYEECSQTYGRIAELLKESGEKEKALGYYGEACRLCKTNWILYYNYGIALKEVIK